MIRTLLYDTVSGHLEEGDRKLVEDWKQDANKLLWLDLYDEPDDIATQLLCGELGLHPLAVQDALRERHPPKVEAFENYTFLLFKGLSQVSESLDFTTLQLAQFVGKRLLVTRHSAESRSVNRLWEEIRQNASRMANGPAILALQLTRIMVEHYLQLILGLEPRLEELEEEILTQPRDEILGELSGYKTDLKKLRRVFVYHQQIFSTLKTHTIANFGEEVTHELNDVYEQQERAGSLTILYYELAADLIDSYISIASHHLNQIMKVLTIITAIFVPLSFLAGIYGMNFEHMPELHSSSGYFILLGVMLGIATLLLLVFRKKRWL
ncbi:MAG: magnesium/cobalt transporter CorA [Gammaproteobacteria bacterium]